jgi:AraC-like DNA-binding protein
MSAFFEGRATNSPYIDMVWRGHVTGEYTPVCPAEPHWNLLFTRQASKVSVAVEGPLTTAKAKHTYDDYEFLVIKFALGVFLEHLPVSDLANTAAILPDATPQSFHLDGSAWQLPDFHNVETFVAQLARAGALVQDPVVRAASVAPMPGQASRTLRRRFMRATGVTQGLIRQVERAKRAVALLECGVPILDTTFQAGYADQPHLTRELRRFYGMTPAQIARIPSVE